MRVGVSKQMKEKAKSSSRLWLPIQACALAAGLLTLAFYFVPLFSLDLNSDLCKANAIPLNNGTLCLCVEGEFGSDCSISDSLRDVPMIPDSALVITHSLTENIGSLREMLVKNGITTTLLYVTIFGDNHNSSLLEAQEYI